MYADTSKMGKFVAYLEKRGAEVLESNNPFEVLRFKIYGELNIIYKNKWGNLTFTGDQCKSAYTKWKDGKNWTPPNRRRQQLSSRKLKIANRDGMGCFFCGSLHKTVQTLTVEHLLSFVHGGTDNINNLALACKPCNEAVGHQSLTQKIMYRDMKRTYPDVRTAEDLGLL